MTGTSVSRRIGGTIATIAASGFALAGLSAFRGQAASTIDPREPVTFTKHVAPILQQKCQVCHQPNSIGPMPLVTYEDAREFARPIKTRVSARVMPPWHIDQNVGIREFKNDRSLTDAEIATIVSWVDGGAPRGDPKDMPPPGKFPDPTGWQLANEFGPPDLVIKSPPYTLAPRTQDKWFRPVSETGLTEPRWVRAIEIKPSYPDGRRIIHHVLTMLEQPEDGITGLAHSAHDAQKSPGLFMEWAVGKVGEVFPADAGKLLLPGARIRWEIHMFAVGQEIRDNQVELGVYFYPKGVVPKHRTVLRMFDVSRGSDLDIPPGEVAMTQNFYVMQAPARLENFQPHMHMRGKSMSVEAVYPDGRKEVLSAVNSFQWNWHVNYIYADHVAPLLPKGTVLVFTAWHDNTAANGSNPDPKQWVGWGDRTVDEMAHAWVDVTYLEQEEFEKLVAERKAKAAGTRP
ncbi:MAG: c-type cytochrome [Vicinamibacterales bacterium]